MSAVDRSALTSTEQWLLEIALKEQYHAPKLETSYGGDRHSTYWIIKLMTAETFLTDRQAANLTGLSLATIRRWRIQWRGPKFLKLGTAVRYKTSDVLAWLDSRPFGGEVITFSPANKPQIEGQAGR